MGAQHPEEILPLNSVSQGTSGLEVHLKTQQEGKSINLYISSNGVYLYDHDPTAWFILV